MPANYSALIRTFNSAKTLADTLTALAAQSRPPDRYVFVDSGSSDETLRILPSDGHLHRYTGIEFNYAAAINQGLSHVPSDYVLIISSHTHLRNPSAIQYALNLLRHDDRIAAAYFTDESADSIQHTLVDKSSFNGFNGLWNTCALVRMSLLKLRNFRPDVFTAEDQEWARWIFFEKDGIVARISGAGMIITNPRQTSLKKRINEYVSIAYFSYPQLLSIGNIASVAFRAIRPSFRQSIDTRIFSFLLFFRLIACRFRRPDRKSRYY